MAAGRFNSYLYLGLWKEQTGLTGDCRRKGSGKDRKSGNLAVVGGAQGVLGEPRVTLFLAGGKTTENETGADRLGDGSLYSSCPT